MRRLIIASTLLLAACATRPQTQTTPELPPETPAVQAPPGALFGRTANELVNAFGQPALQIREGSSVKLQFRGRTCVLDAYLYPSTGGQLRVTHVDTRLITGADTNPAACIRALQGSS